MAPRPRRNEDFNPRAGEVAPAERRVAKQPKGKPPPPTLRRTSSKRIEDRRNEPQGDVVGNILNGPNADAMARYWNRQITPAGKRMMGNNPASAPVRNGRNYGTSMAENMNSYFDRLMSERAPASAEPVTYEDGSSGIPLSPRSRWGQVEYGDIGKTQDQFRENMRQAMLRKQAQGILEGGQPSVQQMLTRDFRRGHPGFQDYTDIADMPVDPVTGANDLREYPNGEKYYEAGNIGTLADALAERRKLMPSALPTMGLDAFRNRRPFSR